MTPRLLLSSLFLFALAGCASTAPATLPLQAQLHPGERMALPEGELHYVGTFDDSRCPPQVQCIHAGDAEVRLQVRTGQGVRDVALHTADSAPVETDGLRIRLLDLTHGPKPVARIGVERAGR